ncbi:uncharacterized protein DFL_005679 [Arthrobotrys flagrans]|uniref:DUF7587 domain-containing protein n=1 Tax=Arthrobotrys flagrans TaxID=97331 RepID=A0A436ZY39_ARTFL|nr:hypothetical protein DFL_005679 [Arthrobotrys flagrans]
MANQNLNTTITYTGSQFQALYDDCYGGGYYDYYGGNDNVNDDDDDENDAYHDTEDYYNDNEDYNDVEYDDSEDYNDVEYDDSEDDNDIEYDDDYEYDYGYDGYDVKFDDDDSGGTEIPILPEKEFPGTLYRIHYSASVTPYSDEEGFLSNDQDPSGSIRLKEFHDHLNWNSRTPSRFISTFSDRPHAFAWAKNWQRKHPYGWYFIMTIKPRKTDEIYHMETVIDHSGVMIPSDCRFQTTQPDEYLFFRQIPRDRIVELFNPENNESLNSWRLVYETRVAPYRQVEDEAGRDPSIEATSDNILLAMRSLSIANAWKYY